MAEQTRAIEYCTNLIMQRNPDYPCREVMDYVCRITQKPCIARKMGESQGLDFPVINPYELEICPAFNLEVDLSKRIAQIKAETEATKLKAKIEDLFRGT